MTKTFSRISGGDILFVLQIVLAYFFALPQVLRMFENTQGVTINWMLCADVFIILNLWLAIGTHKRQDTRESWQTMVIYLNWALLATLMVFVSFAKCDWTRKDSVIALFVGIAAMGVVAWAKAQGKTLTDPVVRGLLVGLFRVVPHVYLSYCIVKAGGGNGLAAKSVIAANITASLRLVMLCRSGFKSGWDRNLVASLVSEIANEGTWIGVTIIWYYC